VCIAVSGPVGSGTIEILTSPDVPPAAAVTRSERMTIRQSLPSLRSRRRPVSSAHARRAYVAGVTARGTVTVAPAGRFLPALIGRTATAPASRTSPVARTTLTGLCRRAALRAALRRCRRLAAPSALR